MIAFTFTFTFTIEAALAIIVFFAAVAAKDTIITMFCIESTTIVAVRAFNVGCNGYGEKSQKR